MQIIDKFWERFFKALEEPIPCRHINTYIRVDDSVATCETTTLICSDCQHEICSITEC